MSRALVKRRVLVACVAALVILTTAPAADAKGPTSARVCGAWVCLSITDVNLIGSALQFNEPFHLLNAPRPAPFYKIEFGRSYGPSFPRR